MTHRQARALMGSRTTRRRGTKSRVMPGGKGGSGKGKQFIAPKFTTRRAAAGKPRLRVLVRRRVETVNQEDGQ